MLTFPKNFSAFGPANCEEKHDISSIKKCSLLSAEKKVSACQPVVNRAIPQDEQESHGVLKAKEKPLKIAVVPLPISSSVISSLSASLRKLIALSTQITLVAFSRLAQRLFDEKYSEGKELCSSTHPLLFSIETTLKEIHSFHRLISQDYKILHMKSLLEKITKQKHSELYVLCDQLLIMLGNQKKNGQLPHPFAYFAPLFSALTLGAPLFQPDLIQKQENLFLRLVNEFPEIIKRELEQPNPAHPSTFITLLHRFLPCHPQTSIEGSLMWVDNPLISAPILKLLASSLSDPALNKKRKDIIDHLKKDDKCVSIKFTGVNYPFLVSSSLLKLKTNYFDQWLKSSLVGDIGKTVDGVKELTVDPVFFKNILDFEPDAQDIKTVLHYLNDEETDLSEIIIRHGKDNFSQLFTLLQIKAVDIELENFEEILSCPEKNWEMVWEKHRHRFKLAFIAWQSEKFYRLPAGVQQYFNKLHLPLFIASSSFPLEINLDKLAPLVKKTLALTWKAPQMNLSLSQLSSLDFITSVLEKCKVSIDWKGSSLKELLKLKEISEGHREKLNLFIKDMSRINDASLLSDLPRLNRLSLTNVSATDTLILNSHQSIQVWNSPSLKEIKLSGDCSNLMILWCKNLEKIETSSRTLCVDSPGAHQLTSIKAPNAYRIQIAGSRALTQEMIQHASDCKVSLQS